MLADQKSRVVLGIVGAGAFAALLTLEILTGESPVSIAELTLESVEILLTVAVAAGVILIISQMQKQQQEKIALVRELDLAHAEGQAWRGEAQRHINGLSIAIQTQFKD